MEKATIYAKKYLEDLLSFFGLHVDIKAKHDSEIINLDVPSTHLNGFLIGSRCQTLKALKALTKAALRNHHPDYYRVEIDIANYKKNHQRRLSRRALKWIQEVKDSGHEKKLKPMSPYDRRIIHQLATAEGIKSESSGQGNQRYVVLKTNK